MSASTIAAIATPPGRGGVGIIRISGTLAFTIAKKITGRLAFEPRQVNFCEFKDPDSQEVIDQGLVIFFKTPHSFTGEDVIEFQSHGSPMVLDQLMTLVVAAGA